VLHDIYAAKTFKPGLRGGKLTVCFFQFQFKPLYFGFKENRVIGVRHGRTSRAGKKDPRKLEASLRAGMGPAFQSQKKFADYPPL
jgi:hypothetical protein